MVAQLERAPDIERLVAIVAGRALGVRPFPRKGVSPRVAHHGEPGSIRRPDAARAGLGLGARLETHGVFVPGERVQRAQKEAGDEVAGERPDPRPTELLRMT